MFHNSTPIWHNPVNDKNFFKEKRLVFGFFGAVGESFKAIGRGVVKVGHYGKRGIKSWPVRACFSPITKAYEYTAKGAHWTYDKITWTGHCAKEAAKGVVGIRNSIGRGFVDLALSPLVAVKRLFVNNFRDVIKGIFVTPVKLIGDVCAIPYRLTKALFTSPKYLVHPIKTIVAMKNAVVKTANGVREKAGHVLDDITGLHFLKLAGRTRDTIFNALKVPAKAIAKPIQHAGQMPYDIVRNTGEAALAYPEGIKKWVLGIRDGVKRIIDSPKAASAIMAAKHAAQKSAIAAIEAPAPA